MAYAARGFAMRSYSDGTGALPREMVGRITPTGVVTFVGSFRRVAWQLDEDVLALTALLSRDGALQTDETVIVKPAIPVTSY